MPSNVERREGDPGSDPLNQVAAQMIEALPADVRAIVMLNTEERGTVALKGYDSDSDAIAEMFVHLTAMFEAAGKKLLLVPLREG